MRNMKTDTVYEEKLTSKWMIGTFGMLGAGFLILLVAQIIGGPLGSNPAPDWFFLIMFLLFGGLTFNFRRMVTRITAGGVTVSYGIARRTIPIGNIVECYTDRALAIKYGGWGIRLWRGKGKWKLVYSVVGSPLVVLSLRKGRIGQFLFSTRNCDQVVKIINEYIAANKSVP
jgi:hypothetical protein